MFLLHIDFKDERPAPARQVAVDPSARQSPFLISIRPAEKPQTIQEIDTMTFPSTTFAG